MTILLDLKFNNDMSKDAFDAIMPDREFIDWNQVKGNPPDLSGVRYIVVWKHDHGLLAKLPGLEVIFSGGAGVDHLFGDPHLPSDLPIVRFVDPDLTTRMSEWVVLQCLMHSRMQRAFDHHQRLHQWCEIPQPVAGDIRVGMMGLGELGLDAARKLQAIGFNVHGWSRSEKTLKGIQTFHSTGGIDAFLAQCDILVSLLPLTSETTGVLNRVLIRKLPQDGAIKPVLINAGRGGSQVEADIIACLKDGTLGGVSLDVFEKEPLDKDSPLWDFDNAILTPHVAAESSTDALVHYVARQIYAHEAGEGLDNLVDVGRGY